MYLELIITINVIFAIFTAVGLALLPMKDPKVEEHYRILRADIEQKITDSPKFGPSIAVFVITIMSLFVLTTAASGDDRYKMNYNTFSDYWIEFKDSNATVCIGRDDYQNTCKYMVKNNNGAISCVPGEPGIMACNKNNTKISKISRNRMVKINNLYDPMP